MSHSAVLSEKSSGTKRVQRKQIAQIARSFRLPALRASASTQRTRKASHQARLPHRYQATRIEPGSRAAPRRAAEGGNLRHRCECFATSAASLISNILEANPAARLIVVGEKLTEASSYSLLRMGVKGLLTYAEAREQLPRTLPLVAEGGFWVPRVLLSTFVDSILEGAHGRQFKNAAAADLSRREQETLEALLENLSNKEIASKLNISERTVKFHVSNLLSKFGVRRRADLILLCYQTRSANA